jgi:hypothetical protein
MAFGMFPTFPDSFLHRKGVFQELMGIPVAFFGPQQACFGSNSANSGFSWGQLE